MTQLHVPLRRKDENLFSFPDLTVFLQAGQIDNSLRHSFFLINKPPQTDVGRLGYRSRLRLIECACSCTVMQNTNKSAWSECGEHLLDCQWSCVWIYICECLRRRPKAVRDGTAQIMDLCSAETIYSLPLSHAAWIFYKSNQPARKWRPWGGKSTALARRFITLYWITFRFWQPPNKSMHKAILDFRNCDKHILVATMQKTKFYVMSWIALHRQRSIPKPPFFKSQQSKQSIIQPSNKIKPENMEMWGN